MVSAPATFRIVVNGIARELDVDGNIPLLTVLRNDLGLKGPKFGCGLGECGACTVIIDGLAARSCVIPVAMTQGREIVTLEGLSEGDAPGLVQRCFIDAQAAQCGYCLNGMILTTKALLDRNATPNDAEIRNELRYNLCRCGTHMEIIEAVKLAVSRLREARGSDA